MRYSDARHALQKAAEARAQRQIGGSENREAARPRLDGPYDLEAGSNYGYDLDGISAENLDHEGGNVPDLDGQPAHNMLNEMRELREAQARQLDEGPCDFLANPSANWGKRKCNMIIHGIAALVFLLEDAPDCEIPINLWLGVQFLFLVQENALLELRERL